MRWEGAFPLRARMFYHFRVILPLLPGNTAFTGIEDPPTPVQCLYLHTTLFLEADLERVRGLFYQLVYA